MVDLSKNDQVANDLQPDFGSKTTSTSKAVANPRYEPLSYSKTGYKSFAEFYPYYLGEHSNAICRRLHLIGSSITVLIASRGFVGALPLIFPEEKRLDILKIGEGRGGWGTVAKVLGLAVVQGYAWAWVGHFFFEKNKPATFKHPLWSLRGDFTLLWEVLTFQRRP